MSAENRSDSGTPAPPAARHWLRRYPPLAQALLAILVIVGLFPSALSINQSNPSTVPEFAPVPPEDDSAPQIGGNVGSLGLGSSSGLTAAVAPTPPQAPPSGGTATAFKPSSKNCVGQPPRQTEDPHSPPCVPFFQGDNGGATYQGVTGDEITLVITIDGGNTLFYTDGETTHGSPNPRTYCDLDLPANTGGDGCYAAGTETDHLRVSIFRALSLYFNNRYQTYNRHVHAWLYWTGADTAEEKEADVADQYERFHPFAALDVGSFFGFNDIYADAMARRKVLLFRSFKGTARSFFQKYAPQIWSFSPDIESTVKVFTSYICKKVAPYPVAHATNGVDRDGDAMNGQQRRYAFMYSSDPRYPGLQHFYKVGKAELAKCGVNPVTTVSFPTAGYDVDTTGDSTYAATNVAKMQSSDATTIIWFAGKETKTGQAADAAKYYPEIVQSGDGSTEGNDNGQLQNQNWWRNAWTVTAQMRQDLVDENSGFQACQEGDPSLSRGYCGLATLYYRDFFMVFMGIQVAGPFLAPQTVDEGFHAIPPNVSNSPYQAACYFDPGDYTCVKDGIEEWWDPNGQAPDSSSPGCWRMRRGGQRFTDQSWPPGDDVFTDFTDPCNSYNSGFFIRSDTP